MKFLVLFGSSTGNTEELAKTVQKVLSTTQQVVDLVNVAEITTIDYNQYNYLFLGASTWDEGQVQLDFRFHLEDLQKNPPNLQGIGFAVFGTGESCYQFFARAVDRLEEAYEAWGAHKIHHSLKIDTLEEDPVDNPKVIQWTQEIVRKLTTNSAI